MGPRIIVLGMHRSGTSSLTRVINLLGVPVCEPGDLYTNRDNPAGHWESRSLIAFNDRLLEMLGGSWYCPPPMPHGWERSAPFADLIPEARATFGSVHPATSWVWKDPRTCLTLPFWRIATRPSAVLLVTRHPEHVAQSLKSRNNFPPLAGLALWERYTRDALIASRGLPVVTVAYERVVVTPRDAVAQLAESFATLGLPLTGDVDEAASSINAGDDHSRPVKLHLSRSQRELLDLTESLAAVSPSFSVPPLSAPAPWAHSLLSLAAHNRWVRVRPRTARHPFARI